MWWLPDGADSPLGGELVFSPEEGLALSLIGTLKPLEEVFKWSERPTEYPIVLGATTDAKRVTLVGCFESEGRIGGGAPSQTLKASRGLMGHHFVSPEEMA